MKVVILAGGIGTRLAEDTDNRPKPMVELGGLAHTVGYRLEDEAIHALPALMKRDLAIETQGPLVRHCLEIGPNRYVELNIGGC